tara:strand:- start:147 stop:686 length:540 start_codon:yes stop_codon:yes gene_type:complete
MNIQDILYGEQQSKGTPSSFMTQGSPEESLRKSKAMQKAAVKKKLSADKPKVESAPQKITTQPPPGSTFAGDAEGLMATGAMAMSTMKAQNSAAAIMGGAMTGLSASTMISGAAAGPIGAAIGVGSALTGMINARKQKKAQQEAQRKQEEAINRAREVQLLQSKSNARQQAIQTLMGAF